MSLIWDRISISWRIINDLLIEGKITREEAEDRRLFVIQGARDDGYFKKKYGGKL